MLPEKILNAREEIKAKVTQTHGKYVGNDIYNFRHAVHGEILSHFMDIVLTMTGEELKWNDWWAYGFKSARTCSECSGYNNLSILSYKIAEEIYNERKGNVSSLPA